MHIAGLDIDETWNQRRHLSIVDMTESRLPRMIMQMYMKNARSLGQGKL